ncbi:MAG: transporter substrate-binding domain-containing protein [Oligoflexales bacterium]|nr:transporter substrate-binding domain-containing protein [Oligoflexales bacterium]
MSFKLKVLTAITLFFACRAAFSGDIKWPEKVSFALYESGYLYDESKDTGIDKDIASEVAKRAGFNIEFVVMTRAKIWHELETGGIMFTGSGIQNPERDKFAWFILYYSEKHYVVRLKKAEAKSAEDFFAKKNLAWGMIRAYKHGAEGDMFLDKLKKEERLEEVKTQKDLYQMLQKERFQAVFGVPTIYSRYLVENNLLDKVEIEDWFSNEEAVPRGLVFSKKHFGENEIKFLRGVLKEIRADGTLQKILAKYVKEDNAKTLLKFKPKE